jgi:hypothetical protein
MSNVRHSSANGKADMSAGNGSDETKATAAQARREIRATMPSAPNEPPRRTTSGPPEASDPTGPAEPPKPVPSPAKKHVIEGDSNGPSPTIPSKADEHKPGQETTSGSPEASDPPSAKSAHKAAMDASMGGASVLGKFALPTDYAAALEGTKKRLVRVPVRRPHRSWWWWAHPNYVLEAATLSEESGGETDLYLVIPELMSELGGDVVLVTLHGAMNRQGTFFIISVRLQGLDGRLDPWTQSLREAIVIAHKEPVRTASNRDLGAYDIWRTPCKIERPPWPEESWEQLFDIAFRGRTIESMDHPVVRRLRGKV